MMPLNSPGGSTCSEAGAERVLLCLAALVIVVLVVGFSRAPSGVVMLIFIYRF